MGEKVNITHERPKLSKKGVTSQDKGVYIPPNERDATDPLMGQLSKEKHIARQNAKKAKALEMNKLSKEYDEKDKQELEPNDLAKEIEELTKLHPSTEKSLRKKIDEIIDGEVRKDLLDLLESKKKSLKGEQ